MNINRNNYEVYFIDFYEGNLTSVQNRALELFLSENPDLKEEFENFEDISVPVPDLTFPGKPQLKKREITAVANINEGNYEEYIIAFYEKDLDGEQQKSLQLFLEANPHLQQEFEWHKTLVAHPEPVIYTGKSSLKKKTAIGYYQLAVAVAAALLILLAFTFLLRQNVPIPRHMREELVKIQPATINSTLTGFSTGKLKRCSIKTTSVQLPLPEHVAKSSIPALAPADIDCITSFPAYYEAINDLLFNYHTQTIQPETMPKRQNLLAQIFRKNLWNMKKKLDVKTIQPKNNQDGNRKKEPGFVRFLDESLLVFNTITGSDAELIKNYDKEGRLRNYCLKGGELITISRKVPPGGSSE